MTKNITKGISPKLIAPLLAVNTALSGWVAFYIESGHISQTLSGALASAVASAVGVYLFGPGQVVAKQ